jgi:hypothetical protein
VCSTGGAVIGSAALPSASIAGRSSATQDIHDIRPPFHIPQDWLWWAGGAGCCAAAALAVALWRWRRRRVTARHASADELALERLRQARTLSSPEHARVFSIAVSGAIRTYIEQRFNIQAGRRTTTEFLRDCVAEPGGLLAQRAEQLREFLSYCDLAKFAGWALSASEMEGMLVSGIAFVTATAKPAVAEQGTNSNGGPGKHAVRRTLADSEARSANDVGENSRTAGGNWARSKRPEACNR